MSHVRPTVRIDWQLIRPARPGKKYARALDEVEAKIEAHLHEATLRVLTPAEVGALTALEDRQDNASIAACEAAHAPRVADDPDWEARLVDEYAESDTDMELDEYLEVRAREFDCERCPHASALSLYPQDPCEVSVGPIEDALVDETLAAALREAMGPDDMRALAERLEAALTADRLRAVEGLDVADLVREAVRFLRFWSRLGFGVRPEVVSELAPIQTDEGPIGPHGEHAAPILH
ncbi:MAG: hypothetical protein IT385_07115 [Deltaproteobacteria bacterium]|nr:hypothetical protein [Deltaproteobacteria bacterium]